MKERKELKGQGRGAEKQRGAALILPHHHHHHHHHPGHSPLLATQAPATPPRPTYMQHRDTLLAGRPPLAQQEGTHAIIRNV